MVNGESNVPDAEAHRLVSLNVGLPRAMGEAGAADPMDRPWTSGICKRRIEGPVWLGSINLAGDGQADRVHHGGPDKAVCVYPALHYPYWRDSLSLPDFGYGAFGENFTVDRVAETDVCIGDTFAVGTARVQISQPRQPCWKLARRWRIRELALRVQETGFTGWYLRVLEEGEVEIGQGLRLIERPHPEWTIARANRLMHHERGDRDGAAELAAVPALSESWRGTLSRRAVTGENPDPGRRLDGTQ